MIGYLYVDADSRIKMLGEKPLFTTINGKIVLLQSRASRVGATNENLTFQHLNDGIHEGPIFYEWNFYMHNN